MVLVAAMTAIGPVSRVLACSCMALEPGQALEFSTVAFVGVVAGAQDPSAGNPVVSTIDPIIYTVVVEDVLKGELDASRPIEVSSARDGASCGMTFAVGQRWRMYAYQEENGSLGTGICSGNELVAEDVPVPAIGELEAQPPPVGVLVAIGLVLVVGGISAWAFTRRGKPSV
jgi:hypothetical protein